ncbi:TOBE domain-containing protein [Shewanella oncorhynchi]|uniref:TOBE domain-containing protein n=1 Tax=Shewanella TaxID=22 RepID=UPI0021DAD069|nr:MULTISPECIES: TOBE domain-containing protein [unclassified Shewanella]MCU8005364.1 TOBE domain-containing protein [Shewanella sp. SM96]MCU8062575.1 TOBE domain-containing protein [Shewanella sp. SM55]
MDLHALLTLSLGDKPFANPRRIGLLEQVANTGSISQGAKLAGISYKAAWDAINEMNTAMPEPVVCSEKGGKGGGGAKLTEFGERLLKVYSITSQVQEMALAALLDESVDMHSLLDVMAHFSLNTSARNQLTGRINSIDSFGLNDKISVTLAGGQQIQISVTHSSRERLQLALDKSVLLLFKAPAVLATTHVCEVDGQNCLSGCLLSVTELGDKAELAIAIDGKDIIYSVMPLTQIQSLAVGESCFACFDATQVILASMN